MKRVAVFVVFVGFWFVGPFPAAAQDTDVNPAVDAGRGDKIEAAKYKGIDGARALYTEVRAGREELDQRAHEINELQKEFAEADSQRKQEIEVQGRLLQHTLESLSASLREKQEMLFELLGTLIAKNPGSVELREMRYESAFGAEEHEIVLEDIEMIPEEKRSDVNLLMIWGHSLERLVYYKEAAECYERALELTSEERKPYVRYRLADCCFNCHWFEKAFDIYTTLARAAPMSAKNQFEPMGLESARYVKYWQAEQALRQVEAEKDDNPIVLFELAAGTLKFELFENQAPNTVANFISLVESGFYNGLVFYKVLNNYMAFTGCPDGNGNGGPGYRIADECRKPGTRMHFVGSLSMVNDNEANNNGSRFMITSVVTWVYNGKQTVFGRVIEGRDLIRRIEKGDKVISAEILRKREHEYKVQKSMK